ncbi:hypothetical protein ACTWP4_19600 [Gracilibacillus sp. D59]|uniref:hypothetical protein n=1 Tax=Gracilibacillus sp. D59 TaxID=3457434 RepID=UPI003FCE6999
MRKKYMFIVMIIVVLCITGCERTNNDIKDYLNSGNSIDTEAKGIMPALNDLSEYEDIEYKYTHKTILMFQSESIALVVHYDDNTYKSEKDELEKEYRFLNHDMTSSFNEKEQIIPEHEFELNSYTFKVVGENEKNNTRYPKSFGMIGTSDEKQSIAYLYFLDTELDYISDSMKDFVKDYFDYDF